MTTTVVVCTYNRCSLIKRLLDTVAESSVTMSDDWECVIVDNNSTDATRRAVDGFCVRDPQHFRYIFEERQGLSHARNRGIKEATGDVVVFVDDDVVVASHWLQEITAPFADPECAGAGGRILPERRFTLPRWLSARTLRQGGVLPVFDAGEAESWLSESPYGANMAYRKSMFYRYGLFRTELGRQGDNLISSEDVEFGRRLLQAGERLRYVPSATVYHAIPEERLSRKYFQSWWFGLGRSSVLLYGRGRDVLGIPRSYFKIAKQCIRLLTSAICWAFAARPALRFEFKLRVWNSAGAISELLRQSFSSLRTRGVLLRGSSTTFGP